MQVNVFITREEGQSQNRLLVLPVEPSTAISKEYQVGWRYYATVPSTDSMFNGVDVEQALAAKGFAVVEPKVPDRR
jgi:hypothetical protein